MSAATIGSALIEQRKQLGLDKGQAAEKIGMSRTTYSSYELDAQRPSVDVFPALAEFLRVTTEELLALYGATSIVVARSSFNRIQTSDNDVSRSADDVEIAPFDAHHSVETDANVICVDAEGEFLALEESEVSNDAATDNDETGAHNSDVPQTDVAVIEIDDAAPWVSSVTSIEDASPRKEKKPKKKKHRGKKK